MNTKDAVIGGALGTVVTVIVGGILAALFATFERGTEAEAEDQIRLVIQEELQVVIDGETKTFAEALSGLHTKMTAIEASLKVLTED